MRTVAVETDDLDLLSDVQPERRRQYEQLHRGRLRTQIREASWGTAALLQERWTRGLRVRCDRPSGYVAYGVVRWVAGDVRWCGAPLAPGSVVRVVDPWELTSSGPVELVCFGVAGAALHAVNVALAGDEWTPLAGNRRLGAAYGARLVERLSAMHRALDVAKAELAALEAAAAELLRIAAHLERSQLATVEPLPHLSRRRAAVRRVEELLDASGDEVPSIPTLCAVAGVSERTLEYAFREQLGMTPVRFLKIRRLNRVRRGLLGAEPGASVTAIALRAGIYDLGRFAGEYRQLFGELPSQTLRRGAASSARPRHAPPEGPEDRLGARRPERGWRRELR